MRFDDRLATVLRLRTQGGAVARVQFRQLVDLLGTMPGEANGPTVDAAFNRLVELAGLIPAEIRARIIDEPGVRLRSARLVSFLSQSEAVVACAAVDHADLTEDQWVDLIPALPLAARGLIPAETRARIIDEPGVRLRSARLVSYLAQSEAAVACAAVSRAELTENQWLDLVPALAPAARGLMRQRAGLPARVEALLDRLGLGPRALPPVAVVEAEAVEPRQVAPSFTPPPVTAVPPAAPAALDASLDADLGPPRGIGDIVRRIEAFRRAREPGGAPAPTASPDAPHLPLGGEDFSLRPPPRLGTFDFTSDAEGRIVWADGAAAPMVVGQRLAPAEQAIRRRQPIRALVMELSGAPAVSGEWHVDAVPTFDALTGRFTGYQGRFRRGGSVVPAAGAMADSEADRMRQLLHELRTPVSAVQGFAEVIQQQLFGPTPHEYRALAANIVADSARILAGFDELERLAKLESGALETEPGETDIGAVIRATVAQLEPHTGPRESGFDIEAQDRPFTVGIAPGEVERLAWRLLATAATCAAPGERLAIHLGVDGGMVKLFLQLPATLAARNDDDLFYASATAATQALSAGMFGTGFTLRLARAEIRAAGGSMTREGGALLIDLPLVSGSGGTADRDTARR